MSRVDDLKAKLHEAERLLAVVEAEMVARMTEVNQSEVLKEFGVGSISGDTPVQVVYDLSAQVEAKVNHILSGGV